MAMDPAVRASIKQAMKDANIDVRHWILDVDGRTPVLTDTAGYLEWAGGEPGGRVSVQVAFDTVGERQVSTVFISMISMPKMDFLGRPLFETMVSGAKEEAFTHYASWEEAEDGHAEIVAALVAEHGVEPHRPS